MVGPTLPRDLLGMELASLVSHGRASSVPADV